MRCTSSSLFARSLCVTAARNFKSRASKRWCSTSEAEPRAIWRNRSNSPSDRLPQPSAIFAPMETAARRSWLVKPYISSRGKSLDASYTASEKAYAFRQTFNSLKSFNRFPRPDLARSQELVAKSSLRNSSPATAVSGYSAPIRTEWQTPRKMTGPPPPAP